MQLILGLVYRFADDEELWRGLYAASQSNDVPKNFMIYSAISLAFRNFIYVSHSQSFEAVVERFLEQLDVSSFWKDTCRASRFEGACKALFLPPRQFYLGETRQFLQNYISKVLHV